MASPISSTSNTGRVSSLDVAKQAGVGQMTVSRVFSGKGYVSQKTREKVLEVARKLNYRPNLAAAAMNSGRFGCVTLLCSTNATRSLLPQNTLMGLDGVLNEQDMHMVFSQLADDDLANPHQIPKALRVSMSDGLLINYNAHIPESLIHQIHQHHIPAVWINAKLAEPCVYPDEEQAGYMAAKHLLDMGHRLIAFLCSGWPDAEGIVRPTLEHFSVVDRQAGYARAMTQADLKPRHIVVQTQRDSDLHVRTLTELLGQPDLPTAMLVNSQAMAGSLCLHAMQLGIKVPSQLSVMCFEKEFQPSGSIAMDAITTPDTVIGQLAGRMILDRIQNPNAAVDPCAVSCSLKAGHTCVPPSSSI